MSDINPAQRRALFSIYERCSRIAELARGSGDPAEEVVAVQVDAAAIDAEFEELNKEVVFAIQVKTPTDRLNGLRDKVLPPDYQFRFPEPAAA